MEELFVGLVSEWEESCGINIDELRFSEGSECRRKVLLAKFSEGDSSRAWADEAGSRSPDGCSSEVSSRISGAVLLRPEPKYKRRRCAISKLSQIPLCNLKKAV